jgi:hypothetical protein
LFKKVSNAVAKADAKKVQEAISGAKTDDVVKKIKAADPQKAASEALSASSSALKRPEAARAAEMLENAGAKVDITVKDPAGESGPTTTTTPKATAEETAKKVGNALEGGGLAKIFQGHGPKDIRDALKDATPKKVVDALQGTDAKKVTEAVSEDTKKVASALQDTTPKDIAEAAQSAVKRAGNSSSPISGAVESVQTAVEGGGAQKVVQAIQEADPKKLAGAVQEAAGAVREVGPENVAKKLEETSAGDVAGALKGASKTDVKDAIKNPSKDTLKKALSAIGGDPSTPSDAGSDEPGTPTASSTSWVFVVLLLLAASVVGGWFTFRRLTRPKRVGSPILQEPSGTDMTVMPGSWMGMGGARDFMSQQPAPGFQRF